jgi:hypothetical protein
MKYKKKPVVIEAFQWDTTDECLDSVDWIYEKLVSGEVGRTTNNLHIKTLEGTMKADVGDYIIKGINGEIYPCKPDIFLKTYEKVE